ncbi:Phosphoprotein phosphatase [Flavobacterium indicum GPTSA100-9 = DSM 17447]|uniref:Phosphoprotein phosphatase n=1 Tax=Flavobacterium indicum (strain DSM 17447 / CIP 109464 / GPTSA100-9) TaxID=1094466 RepID=H8XRR5_FLAIG|nr:metallophosphoesterase [Flavobacterium indicum]CCG54499.1 Phosphoprotein phosphatase [Flavobacterium indicum GPTSA100-9 = DSM 17447]
MKRTLVVGDIHGGYRALLQILERANVTTEDTLIFLGDYMDGWSESPEVLDFLIQLNQTHTCIFIKGNHDELVIDWLEERFENINESMWFKHGGKATVEAYANIDKVKKKEHIAFLKELKNYYLDSENRLFIHAGFTNLHGVEYEYFPKLFYWDRTLWEMALAMDETLGKEDLLYPNRLKIYTEIYIGHTPTTRIGQTVPVNKACIWNVDTGAAFKGPLTILDINTKEYWQSDVLPSLYPNETGRN